MTTRPYICASNYGRGLKIVLWLISYVHNFLENPITQIHAFISGILLFYDLNWPNSYSLMFRLKAE